MNDTPHAEDASRDPSLPEDLDAALQFAYGKSELRESPPSVLAAMGEGTEYPSRLALRDDGEVNSPLLKPRAPGERTDAGKYLVHGELGRGGVGAVFRGHDQDLGRDVALKFLHEDFSKEQAVVQRFVEEAQIGGQLQHPGIVPVYDLGLSEGRPFFSMKLVKGQTLAKKLAERTSVTEDRRSNLAIFEDICQTLAYAHARGVVHRDLKPANVMIGSFGEVQVVDWGMGKVLQSGGIADERAAAERQATLSVIETVRSTSYGSRSVVGSVMGTPAYMPPEQARGDVEAMDERSDVFALGAILCEILTGKPPYVGKQDELIGMAARGDLSEAHARLENAEADTEMIELATRCLMQAPAARPRSAGAVAEAVHLHLAAVEARVHAARVEAAEAGVRAVALKRTQRLGAGLLLVIATGLGASLFFWQRAHHAATSERNAKIAAQASEEEAKASETLAIEQTAIARRELARAIEIKTLISEMLESVTPEEAEGADIELLMGILNSASERLAEGAIEDEQVAAELHELTGNVYVRIGQFAAAERHLPAAQEILERTLGGEHPSTLAATRSRAILDRLQGRYDEAERLLLRVLEATEALHGRTHGTTLGIAQDLARTYTEQGRYEEAGPLYLEIAEGFEQLLGEGHAATLAAKNDLAILHRDRGRLAESEAVALEVSERLELELGEDHPQTLSSLNFLATIHLQRGRYDEAEVAFARVLEIAERVFGEEHPNTMSALTGLAVLHRLQGRLDVAEPLLVRAVELSGRILGEDHPDTLNRRGNLARNYLVQERYPEAESHLGPLVEAMARAKGAEHPDTLALQSDLANLYSSQGRIDEAEPLYVETLEAHVRLFGEDHPDTLITMSGLASLYQKQGRMTEAIPLRLRTMEIGERVWGPEHPNVLGMSIELGNLYLQAERYEEARATLEENLAKMLPVLPPVHPWTTYARLSLIKVYIALERLEEALDFQRECREILLAAVDAEAASVEALVEAAWLLLTFLDEEERDPYQALVLVERALSATDSSNTTLYWRLLHTLALAQYSTGETSAAVTTQRRALEAMPEGLDPDVARRLAEYEAAVETR